MGLIPEQDLVARALLQHFAPLKGVRGAAALIGINGRWSEAARFGEVLTDRLEPAVRAFGQQEGGAVEPLPSGGWAAVYNTRAPGLDMVLVLNIAAIGPADLQSLLEGVELRVGWVLVAALRANTREDGERSLAAELGAGLLLGAARARDRGALADLWLAQLEAIYHPALAAILWTPAGAPRLAVVSGGGPVTSESGHRNQLQDLARRAVEARVPVLVAAAAGDHALPVDPALADLGAASAWIIPIEDGREVAAVAVLCLSAAPAQAPGPALADQVAALLSESLTVQTRAHPRLLRRLGNWLLAGFVAVFGKTLWKLKVAVLLLALSVSVAALTPAVQRPGFTATVEAVDRQIISAAFDGFLSRAPYQSGDKVAAGDVLVQLDDSDVRLQLTQRRSELAEIETQLQTARAQRDSARVRQLETRRDQGRIAIALLERQLERAAAVADRPMIVVGGDAWRRVGDRVRLGEPLLELASPDRFRLRAFVGEDWVSDLADGTVGEVALTAFPDRPIPVTLLGIGRDAAMVNGEYAFPVLLELTPPPDLSVLDGMRGVVRLDLGQGSLLYVYTHGLRRWVDRTLWRWG